MEDVRVYMVVNLEIEDKDKKFCLESIRRIGLLLYQPTDPTGHMVCRYIP